MVISRNPVLFYDEEKLKKTTFYSENSDDEFFIEQVIAGKKTATAYPKVWYYHTPGEEPTNAGDLVAVYNQKGIHRCTIEITENYEIPLGKVDEKVLRGENFLSKDDFIKFMEFCYSDLLIRDGRTLDENTIMVIEHFRLVSTTTNNSNT